MRSLKIAPAYSVAVVWTLLAACGGKSAESGVAPVALSDVPAKAVAAFCTGYGNCCASKGFAFNATACAANHQVNPDTICPAPEVYDPQAAGDCIAELQAAYSACSLSRTAMSACDRVCIGTAAPGASCTSDSDCAQPAFGTASCAWQNASSAALVCVVRVPGKEGDACSSTCTKSADGNGLACDSGVPVVGVTNSQPSGAASCYTNDGLYCSTNSVCQPLVAIGSSCTAGDVCVNGAYCTTAQICGPQKAAGATCDTPLECLGDCDLVTQLCVSVDATPRLDVTAASCANPPS